MASLGQKVVKSAATAGPSSSPNARTQVIRMYRYFLRLQRHWTEEPTRPGRNLKEHLKKKIAQEFREGASADPQKAARLLQNGERQLMAAKRILNKEYANKYPVPSNFEPVHRPAYQLLSTDARGRQTKITPQALFIPMVTTWLKYKWELFTGKQK